MMTDQSLTPNYQDVFVIVMGVSGTGKSTLGAALASALGVPYVEGDDLHPPSNVLKMAEGRPLTDADREPWLKLIRATAEEQIALRRGTSGSGGGCSDDDGGGCGVVISCSALKASYRDLLRGGGKKGGGVDEGELASDAAPVAGGIRTFFVFIDGPRDLLVERMERRTGHFMKVSMLDSQLAALERPEGEEGVVVVSLLDSTSEQVAQAKGRLGELVRKSGIHSTAL